MKSESASLPPDQRDESPVDFVLRATAEPAADPAIAALIGKLPAPGAEWPAAKRVHWLRCLAGVFDLVYRTEDDEVAIVHQPPKGRPR